MPPAKSPLSPAKKPTAFGDLYLEPTRKPGDTQESYTARLNTERSVNERKKPPTSIPGSFTLLTERNAAGEPTGESGFDNEIERLLTRKSDLERELQQKKKPEERNAHREGKQKKEVTEIDRAIKALEDASVTQYTKGKTLGTFYTKPLKQPNEELNKTLEWVALHRGEKVVAKMGKEIESTRVKEFLQLKEVARRALEENKDLKARLASALNGQLPLSKEVEENLLGLEAFLKHVRKSYQDGGEVTLMSEEGVEALLKTVDELLTGTYKKIESLERKDLHTVLSELLAEGVEITKETLTAKGVPSEEIVSTLAFLKEQGVIS